MLKILIYPDVTNKFRKACSFLLAITENDSKEIDRLNKAGILKPVRHLDWTTPVVPVLKIDGSIRLRADFKITANKAILIEQYTLPKSDDIFPARSCGEKIYKIYFRDACNQMKFDKES